MNDIDLSTVDNWNPIGKESSYFTGTFDGNGHVIKNLKSTKGGLFGEVKGATLKNVGFENIDINSSTNLAGGLAGRAIDSSKISNCYAKGSVKGVQHVGGLIGFVQKNDNTITNCFSQCDVYGTASVGVLIGSAFGLNTISDCYAIGSAKGTNTTALLIGGMNNDGSSTNLAIVKNCYAQGTVTSYGNSTEYRAVGGLGGSWLGTKVENCYVDATVNAPETSEKFKSGLLVGNFRDLSEAKNICIVKNNSGIKNTFGYNLDSSYDNLSVTTNQEAKNNSIWKQFDSNIWDKTSFPPRLKNMPKVTYNFSGSNEFRLQVGANSNPDANAMFVNTGISMGELEIDLSTTNGCLDAIDCVQAALDAVAQKTSDIGVYQSRLETISNVNTTKIENLSAAYSTVAEADVAQEVANFTKSQIMAQTASSLITQAQAFQANLVLRMINSLG